MACRQKNTDWAHFKSDINNRNMFSFNIVVESLTYGHKDNQNNFDMCFVKFTELKV